MKEPIENREELFSLFETYGALLTKTQESIMSDYLSFDLSFSEIASNRSVSRSAVEDALKKGEKKLREYEKKLGVIASKEEIKSAYNKGKESGDYKELEDIINGI